VLPPSEIKLIKIMKMAQHGGPICARFAIEIETWDAGAFH
jgi:hypothetical protein